jgi:hypothetical protein
MPYLPAIVDDAEELTNFVIESNKFRKEALPTGGTKDVLHYKAFMCDKGGERSVFRMGGLAHNVIVEWGRVFVALQRDKSLLGWGQIPAGTVRQVTSLRVRSDEPPPRHAVIDQWPIDIEQSRALALVLAASQSAATILP